MTQNPTSRLPGLIALSLFALSAAGCSSVQYFHIALNPPSAPTGNNCAGTVTDMYTGIASSTEWSMYTAPNNASGQPQYMLEGAVAGDFLVGTLANGTYSFTGSNTVAVMTGNIQTTTTVTVMMQVTSSGVTGTLSTETSCQSGNGMQCQSPIASNQGPNFDCTSTSSFMGTALSNVTAQHAQESESSGSTGGLI